jgi:hypothetical protein
MWRVVDINLYTVCELHPCFIPLSASSIRQIVGDRLLQVRRGDQGGSEKHVQLCETQPDITVTFLESLFEIDPMEIRRRILT